MRPIGNVAKRRRVFVPGRDLVQQGQSERAGYACPLSQYLLADALGLSAVHVKRVLRHLREAGIAMFRDGFVAFDDCARPRDHAQTQTHPQQRQALSDDPPTCLASSCCSAQDLGQDADSCLTQRSQDAQRSL